MMEPTLAKQKKKKRYLGNKAQQDLFMKPCNQGETAISASIKKKSQGKPPSWVDPTPDTMMRKTMMRK